MPGRTQPTRLYLPNAIRGAQQQGKQAGMQQEMTVADTRWVGVPNAVGAWPPPTGDPTQGYAVEKHGTQLGFVAPSTPTLTSSLTAGTAYTSLPVTALGNTVYANQIVVLVSGGSGGLVQAWTVSATAAAGATAIPVLSQLATSTFPVGTIASGAAAQVPGVGTAMWRQGQVLTTALTSGTTYTSLAVTSFLPAVNGTPQIGAVITLIAPGAVPVNIQQWALTTAANAGTTTLTVASQAANANYPTGTLVGLWMPL